MHRNLDKSWSRGVVALASLLSTPAAIAAAETAATLPVDVGVNTGLLRVTLNLLLVLAAIVILAWVFRRVQTFGQPAAGSLRIAATLPLGPKERILLLEAGDQQLLIGASAAGLATLHVLETPIQTLADAPATFKDRLSAALAGTQS